MQDVKSEVNGLPEILSQGRITKREAINKIAEIVMRNPHVFSLIDESDEIRSEVCLRLLLSGESVFNHFNFSSSSFLTYLSNHIKFLVLTIKRNLHNEIIINQTFDSMNILEFEETVSKYEESSESFTISNLIPYQLKRTEKVPFVRKGHQTPISSANKNELQSKNDFMLDYFRENHSSEGKVTLITALKYCFYLSDEELKNIARFCRCSISKLKKCSEYLISSIKNKTSNIETLKKSRNREYFLHKKYSAEIENCRRNQKDDVIIQKKLENHTKLWKSRNKIIKEKISKLCPTNKKIAEVLGICEREVGYYIKKKEVLEKIRKSLSADESGL